MNTKQPQLTDISGIIAALPPEKQKLYINTLYSIARTAIDARCGELRMMDLEIMQSLEDESNARFEEWLFR
jgi:hypothetical protein